MEAWRTIEGFPYEVSSAGRVRRSLPGKNTSVGRLLRVQRTPKGYCWVNLRATGRYHARYVHRLVAAAFLPPADSARAAVNHLNGAKDDNRPENLEWVTNAENTQHAKRLGLLRSPSRFSADDIAAMRALVTAGVLQQEVADRFGCANSYVSRVYNRLRRAGVP